MNDEPKTLTLTFEETVEALGREGMEFRVESPTGNGATWAVHQWSKEEKRVVLVCCCYGTWPEAASDALRCPVVARDDAAELRAVVRLSARLLEWLSSREGTAPEDAREAEEVVRRARAALAASEGQP